MFFERERGIRPGDSHGDIVFWPLLALAQYLLASGDAGLLDETAPFFHPEGDARAEHATVLAHVERALGADRAARDSGHAARGLRPRRLERLAPARRPRARRAAVQRVDGHAPSPDARHARGGAAAAPAARGLADELEAQLPRHPRRLPAPARRGRRRGRASRTSAATGRSSTGCTRATARPASATACCRWSTRSSPISSRASRRSTTSTDPRATCSRPTARACSIGRCRIAAASSATSSARRPAPSSAARSGSCTPTRTSAMRRRWRASATRRRSSWRCARRIPWACATVVPNARLRQANCYTSSSDAAFPDRYQAAARYDEVKTGAVAVEGGWRVYSSGAGIAVRLVRECLLGLRLRRAELGIDPVLPRALDGLRAHGRDRRPRRSSCATASARAASGRGRCAERRRAGVRARGESVPRGRRARGDGRRCASGCATARTRSLVELG